MNAGTNSRRFHPPPPPMPSFTPPSDPHEPHPDITDPATSTTSTSTSTSTSTVPVASPTPVQPVGFSYGFQPGAVMLKSRFAPPPPPTPVQPSSSPSSSPPLESLPTRTTSPSPPPNASPPTVKRLWTVPPPPPPTNGAAAVPFQLPARQLSQPPSITSTTTSITPPTVPPFTPPPTVTVTPFPPTVPPFNVQALRSVTPPLLSQTTSTTQIMSSTVTPDTSSSYHHTHQDSNSTHDESNTSYDTGYDRQGSSEEQEQEWNGNPLARQAKAQVVETDTSVTTPIATPIPIVTPTPILNRIPSPSPSPPPRTSIPNRTPSPSLSAPTTTSISPSSSFKDLPSMPSYGLVSKSRVQHTTRIGDALNDADDDDMLAAVATTSSTAWNFSSPINGTPNIKNTLTHSFNTPNTSTFNTPNSNSFVPPMLSSMASSPMYVPSSITSNASSSTLSPSALLLTSPAMPPISSRLEPLPSPVTTQPTPSLNIASIQPMPGKTLGSSASTQSLPSVNDDTTSTTTGSGQYSSRTYIPRQHDAFTSESFLLMDQFLSNLRDIDESNPLASMVYETAMCVREILNCWREKRLHGVACESLHERMVKIRASLNQQCEQQPIRLQGRLDKQSQRGWLTRDVHVHLDKLYSVKGSEVKVIKLRDIISVHELHSGKEPEFSFVVRQPPVKGQVGNTQKTYTYRARSDAERQRWMSLLSLYQQQSRAAENIHAMSIPEKVEVYLGSIYCYRPDRRDEDDKSNDFLFSNPPIRWSQAALDDFNNTTTNVGSISPSPASNNTSPEQSRIASPEPSRIHSTNGHDSDNDDDGHINEHDIHVGRGMGFGMVERFSVLWPQTIGAAKNRDIEIDLNEPHRLIMYKPAPKGGSDIPDLIFNSTDFLDYKCSFKTRELELSCRTDMTGGRFRRKFIFPSHMHLSRFMDLLLMFQLPAETERFRFVHDDVLHVLSHLRHTATSSANANTLRKRITSIQETAINRSNPQSPPSPRRHANLYNNHDDTSTSKRHSFYSRTHTHTPDDDDDRPNARGRTRQRGGDEHRTMSSVGEGTGIFRGQLHSLFAAMADNVPNNSHCRDLLSRSDSLPLDPISDIERLRILAIKLYAVDLIGNQIKVDEITCKCHHHTGPNECLLLMYRAFLQAEGLQDLRRFLHADLEELQTWSLKCIWQVFVVKHHIYKCTGALRQSEIDYSAVSRYPFPWYVNILHLVGPLRESVIHALFEILVQKVRVTPSRSLLHYQQQLKGGGQSSPRNKDQNSAMSTPAASTSLNGDTLQFMNRPIVEISMLPVLLHALSQTTPTVSSTALQQFILMLNDPQNHAPFLNRAGWQTWMFPLFLERDGNGHCHIKDTKSDSFKYAMALFTNLHYQQLTLETLNKKKSTKSAPLMRSSLDTLSHFATWESDTIVLGRIILMSVINKIKSRTRDFSQNNDFTIPSIWETFYGVTSAVEEFLFFRPVKSQHHSPASTATPRQPGRTASPPSSSSPSSPSDDSLDTGVHMSSDGQCVDLPLVDILIECIQSFGLHRPLSDHVDASKDERLVRTRGVQEYNFFCLVRECFIGIGNTQKEHERYKALQFLSKAVMERSKLNGWNPKKQINLTPSTSVITRVDYKVI